MLGVQVQVTNPSIPRRPGIVGTPPIGPGFEHEGFRQIQVPLVFQVEVEEGQLHLFSIVHGCVGSKADVAQAVTGPVDPASVTPRTDDQRVLIRRVVSFDRGVDTQWTVIILRIEPARHVEYGMRDIIQVFEQVLGLPVLIVGPVLDELVPHRDPAVKALVVHIGDGAKIQKKTIPVGSTVLVLADLPLRRALPHLCALPGPVEAVHQAEGAVVVVVVPDVLVRRTGLRRGGLKCRMGLDHSHDSQPTGVGDPPLPHSSVGTGNGFQEPFDRIVGVTRIIGVKRAALVSDIRAVMLEQAFGTEFAPDVLIDKDIPFPGKSGRRSQGGLVAVGTVGAQTVGGALEKDRIVLRVVLGNIHFSEQPNTVSHRNHVFELGVVLFNEAGTLRAERQRGNQ